VIAQFAAHYGSIARTNGALDRRVEQDATFGSAQAR
jgi:hypothetical protein